MANWPFCINKFDLIYLKPDRGLLAAADGAWPSVLMLLLTTDFVAPLNGSLRNFNTILWHLSAGNRKPMRLFWQWPISAHFSHQKRPYSPKWPNFCERLSYWLQITICFWILWKVVLKIRTSRASINLQFDLDVQYIISQTDIYGKTHYQHPETRNKP